MVGGVAVLLVEGVLMLHHRHWCWCGQGIAAAAAAVYGTVGGQGHRIVVLWERQGGGGVWALCRCSGVQQGWLPF